MNRTLTLPPSMRMIQRDWLSSNQVLFFDDTDAPQATLVDAGYVKHADMTVALVRRLLAERGMADSSLSLLLNTHLHSDHCGGNAAVSAAFGCPVAVPAAEFDAVNVWDDEALSFRGTGQRCARFTADRALDSGETLTLGGTQWTVHAAPGHDPHSLILHCAEHRLLISADALWENGFGVIFPELEGASGFDEQGAVLDLIATLPVDIVIPGHGRMFGDVPAAIARARQRLAAMRADPVRNARNAIRVLLKFLLLDRERIQVATLADELRDASVMSNAAAMMGMTLAKAIDWSCAELLAQSQAALDDGWLVNRDP